MQWYLSIAIMVAFDSLVYSIVEDNGLVQPALILSGPSAVNITVVVVNSDITAIGKC